MVRMSRVFTILLLVAALMLAGYGGTGSGGTGSTPTGEKQKQAHLSSQKVAAAVRRLEQGKITLRRDLRRRLPSAM